MKKHLVILTALSLLVLFSSRLTADDTCIFAVTADDVPPAVTILLDNGADMSHAAEHSGYQPNVDYTPTVVMENEGVNGFFNENGYAIKYQNASAVTLCPIKDDLTIDTANPLASVTTDNTAVTINNVPFYKFSNGTKIIYLPVDPTLNPVYQEDVSAFTGAASPEYLKETAAHFRFSKNYLNYLFFSGSYVGDGQDCPMYTRFFLAKKAILQAAHAAADKARFGVYAFSSNADGASNVQPLKIVADADGNLDSAFFNNINNMVPVTYAPLAEGLSTIGEAFASSKSKTAWPELEDSLEYCIKAFTIVVSSGVSSEDQSPSGIPGSFSDYDEDGENGTLTVGGVTYTIPTHLNGSTYLDDVAHYLYSHDIPEYVEGFQNIYTYTLGVMSSPAAKAYLINTSNNGNGNFNLTNPADPEYGKYHFEASNPEAIADALMSALNAILSRTATFTAPVVPVTRTSSGDYIYLAFFKPLDTNFWEGNITKFGLDANNQIIDKDGNAATWANGAMKDTAVPYWATFDWADATKANYMANASRAIYTYLGASTDLTASGNAFSADNADLTLAALGTPVKGTSPRADLIAYIRGADSYDEDKDGDTTENRRVITGDALHVEPVVFSYTYRQGEAEPGTGNEFKKLFYTANDGMLHMVNDSDGTEGWGFIPPSQIARLKLIVEEVGHQYLLDSSPRICFIDHNGDGVIDDGNSDGNWDEGEDRVILIFGERKGGSSYHALDVTYPGSPVYLWEFSPADAAELGETWSEPVFGKVKTTDVDTTGTWVMFVGGGFDGANAKGRGVFAINVLTGDTVKSFTNANTTGMDYSIISNITLVDADPFNQEECDEISCSDGADNDGDGLVDEPKPSQFVDKIYVGDLGGNLWRIGNFSSTDFYFNDENINNWSAQILFSAGCDESSCSDGADNDGDGLVDERTQFQYAPDVTLEWGYDLIFIGSGDREIACEDGTAEAFYSIKDNHVWNGLTEADLLSVARPAEGDPLVPQLDNADADVDENNLTDKGWYYPLADGEKALAEPVVFNKVAYFTTFVPNNDPCVPGGISYLYGLGYKTGAAALEIDTSGKTDNVSVGGGIASKPVVVLKEGSQRMLISVGSTSPDVESESTNAGVVSFNAGNLPNNFFFLWWRELFQ